MLADPQKEKHDSLEFPVQHEKSILKPVHLH